MSDEYDGTQAMPVPNDGPSMHDLVIEDMRGRKDFGLTKYGSLLQAHNGRDALKDLYDELLDAIVYTRQLIEERGEDGNLVEHARRELELIGEEPDTIEGYLNVIRAFSAMGHSGGSASVAIPVIHDLLQYKHLSPITDSPDEWYDHGEMSGTPLWQCIRNGALFSNDGGKTYYDVDDPKRTMMTSRPSDATVQRLTDETEAGYDVDKLVEKHRTLVEEELEK